MLYQMPSPPAPFYFSWTETFQQLSQPHCYLAPPEATTAFNQEQWLTGHTPWDLGEGGFPPKKPPYTEFQDVKAGRCTQDIFLHNWGPVPLQRGSFQPKRDAAAPASSLLKVSRATVPAGASLPSCKRTLDTQKVPHFQIKMKANFQVMHAISVELIVIIVIGSCWEVRSREAEKRNQSFVGLRRIRKVAIRLLKKK